MQQLVQKVAKSRNTPRQRPFDDHMIQVVCGPMLCRLHVWTDEEWAELEESKRPTFYVHAPGLGWVGAIAILSQN